LTYSQGTPEILNGSTPSTSRPYTTTYSPPFDEFEVSKVSIHGNILTAMQSHGMQDSLYSLVRASPFSLYLKYALHLHADSLLWRVGI